MTITAHSTSTEHLRDPALDDDIKIVPEHRRHILEAPCDLCNDVAWVTFRDGLCGRCVTISALAMAEDRKRSDSRTRALTRSRR